jgi:hypothetical protein
MVASRGAFVLAGVAVAALVALAPVVAAIPKSSHRNASSFRMADGIGSFTPAAADARRALSFGRAGLADSGFRFTPSVAPGSRRAVTVAIRARGTNPARNAPQGTAMAALAPSAYNLGLAVGWKRFALTGDVARVEGGLLPLDREAADVGLSYSGNKWSTRLQLGAERAIGNHTRLAGVDESYSVDLGGSYALTRNLEVTGGVRYKLQRDRLERLADNRQDSQAVYIGTAFRF